MPRLRRLYAMAREVAYYVLALILIAVLAGVGLLAMGDHTSRVLSTVSGGI